MRGLFERMCRCLKRYLRKILEQARVNYQDLLRLLKELKFF